MPIHLWNWYYAASEVPTKRSMLSAIYKSPVKADTYLYVEKRDDFSRVPEALLKTFGKPQFVMLVNMAKRETLAIADIEQVKNSLVEQGFYLQLPPKEDNLLDIHRKQTGVVND